LPRTVERPMYARLRVRVDAEAHQASDRSRPAEVVRHVAALARLVRLVHAHRLADDAPDAGCLRDLPRRLVLARPLVVARGLEVVVTSAHLADPDPRRNVHALTAAVGDAAAVPVLVRRSRQ